MRRELSRQGTWNHAALVVAAVVAVTWYSGHTGYAAPPSSDAAPAVLHDAEIIVDKVLLAGQRASLEIGLREASSPRSGRDVEGTVVITLLRFSDTKGVAMHRWPLLTTKLAAGLSTLEFEVPRVPVGRDYHLEVMTQSAAGRSTRLHPVQIVHRDTALVWLDQASVRPGTLVRWAARLWKPASTAPQVGTTLKVSVGQPWGGSLPAVHTTDAFGMAHGEFRVPPDAKHGTYVFSVHSRGHHRQVRFDVTGPTFRRRVRDRPRPKPKMGVAPKVTAHKSLEVPHLVARSGSPIRVACSGNHELERVALLHGGVPVATAACVRGAPSVALTPPQGVFGMVGLRRTVANRSTPAKSPVTRRTSPRRKRLDEVWSFVPPKRLDVQVAYLASVSDGKAPGVTLGVKDSEGKPVAGARVSLSVVDASLAPVWRRDAMEHLLEVDPKLRLIAPKVPTHAWQAVATPSHRATLERHLKGQRRRLSAVAQAQVSVPAWERFNAELVRLSDAKTTLARSLPRRPGAAPGNAPIAKLLRVAGWTSKRVTTPWGKPADWAYFAEIDPRFTPDAVALDVTRTRLGMWERRLHRYPKRVRRHFFKRGRSDLEPFVRSRVHLRTDGWGGAFVASALNGAVEVRSPGSDRKLRTDDDVRVLVSFGEVGSGFVGVGAS